MTEGDIADARPFWERKTLEEMTPEEWESVCDGCGRCCLMKLTAVETNKSYTTDIGCPLLDTKTSQCSDYPNRLSYDVLCAKVTPAVIRSWEWMPPSCGYRRIDEGKGLAWWHPLVSGDPTTVRKAGISIEGRAIVRAKAGRMEYHTIDWPTWFDSEAPHDRWMRAWFGGVNASVPTPFGADLKPDLDAMAAHCFWLLSNGCDHLAILDGAGEGASLTIAERIGVIEGLAARRVPVSKMLPCIGPASGPDSVRIAGAAETLGIRGVLLAAQAGQKVTPQDVLPGRIKDITQRTNGNLALYLSLPPVASGSAARVTAIEALVRHPDARLAGVRDETPGCSVGLAVLERVRDGRLEVYTSDETMLMPLVRQGGAGLISGGANVLGRLCRAVIRDEAAGATERYVGIIGRTAAVLREGSAVASLKALIARHTGQAGWERMRRPLRPLDPSRRLALFRGFDASGVRLLPVGTDEDSDEAETEPHHGG